MFLIDLLQAIDENSKQVNILDLNNKVVSFYDGKNSIDNKYNYYTVKTIQAIKAGCLDVTIYLSI